MLTARFIPGGRTMVTVASGLTHQPFARFAFFDLIASFLWATYAGTLGFFFGEQFADNHTLAFVLAFVTALAVSGVVELVRHFRNRGRQV